MIDTILFDLDGTLLNFDEDNFIKIYFGLLRDTFVKQGFDGSKAIKAVLEATKAVVQNDGKTFNRQLFWETFAKLLTLDSSTIKAMEATCDAFYSNEFNLVKQVLEHSDIPARLVTSLIGRGYTLVLATNPLFPEVAVKSRLNWVGLTPENFLLVTNYSNSHFCKPNLNYYREILQKINKNPEQCLMIGNNVTEDMCAGQLGMELFLVTDCLENKEQIDISKFRHGSLADLERFLATFSKV